MLVGVRKATMYPLMHINSQNAIVTIQWYMVSRAIGQKRSKPYVLFRVFVNTTPILLGLIACLRPTANRQMPNMRMLLRISRRIPSHC